MKHNKFKNRNTSESYSSDVFLLRNLVRSSFSEVYTLIDEKKDLEKLKHFSFFTQEENYNLVIFSNMFYLLTKKYFLCNI